MKIRKNDKAYLQDLKVDIRASKDINYQELALLFDKPQFLNLLQNLRQTYEVVNLYPLDNFIENIDDFYKKFLRSKDRLIKIHKDTRNRRIISCIFSFIGRQSH